VRVVRYAHFFDDAMDKLKPLGACGQSPSRDYRRRNLRMRRKLVIIGYEMNRHPFAFCNHHCDCAMRTS